MTSPHSTVPASNRCSRPCSGHASRTFIGKQIFLTPVVLLWFIVAVHAQTHFYGEPEIRRATPVLPQEIQEIPSPPAVPFDAVDPLLAPTPTPEEAPPSPQPDSAVPPQDISDPNEIRMAPAQPTQSEQDQILFDTANGLYTRKLYDLAAAEYQRYLSEFPAGPDRQAVLFRLAECLRVQNRENAALEAYEQLLIDYATGEFVGPASYRLGMLYYGQGNFQGALPLFQRAATRVEQQELKLASRYQEAKTLENLNRKAEMLEAYREIAAIRENNPYLETARLALAQYSGSMGRHSESLAAYEALATESESPEIRVQATVQAAIAAADLKQFDKSLEYYEKALTLPKLGPWEPIAQAGYFRSLYATGKFEQLLEQYQQREEMISASILPEMLLLVGNAERELGRNEAAAKTYAKLRQNFPNSQESRDAGIQELVAAFMAGDENLDAKVDAYIKTNPPGDLADQARLIKAEALFKKEDYAGAGAIYAALLDSELQPRLRAETLNKLGWCYTKVNNFERAAQVYTMFLDEFGDHEHEAAARLQRGMSYQKLARYDDALLDFSRLASASSKVKEREIALQQKALLQGQLNDNRGMVESFTLLLKDYPDSGASAQANYWIGWAYFEAKDYENAIPYLTAARENDKEQYFDRASLRILLSQYYTENIAGLKTEVLLYQEAEAKPPVPAEVLRYLGAKLIETNQLADAEQFLQFAANAGGLDKETLLSLARVQIQQGNFVEAQKSVREALKNIEEPLPKAQALVLLGRAQAGAGEIDAARKTTEEILKLQPEGRVNAEGRILLGEIEMKAGNYAEASRALMSVVVLYEDVRITPRAMDLAIAAFEKAGNSAEAQRLAGELRTRYPDYKAQ